MTVSLEQLKPFIDWLQANPGLASLAVFAISCAESLAIIGLFIPGTIVMPAIGSMIGSGVLPPYLIIGAAILGAVVGDNLSYWLGYHYHHRIRNIWPFYHYPKLLSKGEHFFYRYGGLSVFIGRFVGPVRPIIPVVAGMLNMKPNRFFIANLTSAIAWALVYMAPGILLGYVSEQLAPHTATRFLVILAIASIALWAFWWLGTKLYLGIVNWLNNRIETLWQKQSANRLRDLIHHEVMPQSHKPLAFLIYPVILSLMLIFITHSILKQGFITYLDWPVYLFFKSIQIDPLDTLVGSFIAFSTFTTMAAVIVAVLLWLLIQKSWRAAFCWVFNPALSLALASILKAKAAIPRPGFSDIASTFWSFPSLHTALFTALIGNLIIFVYYRTWWQKYQRYFIYGILFLFCIVIVPQLYFGTNWLSDQIAAGLCGTVTTHITLIIYHRSKCKLYLKPVLFITLFAWLIPSIAIGTLYTSEEIKTFDKAYFTLNFKGNNWWHGQALPVSLYRTNFFGEVKEPLTVQYAGPLNLLIHHLKLRGWEVAPKPDLAVIINRIAAKNRGEQLPLLPDLYRARKPSLIMTKWINYPHKMVIMRLWPSDVMLQPDNQPLWVGTIKYHEVWSWDRPHHALNQYLLSAKTPLLILENDLDGFVAETTTYGATADCITFIEHLPCDEPILKITSDDWFKLMLADHRSL